MATAKDCHTLTSYFVKGFKEKYGIEPVINRHSARWGFDSVLVDMSMLTAKSLIDYYFTTANPRRHSLDWFLYNYEKLVVAMADQRKDAERRDKLRSESAKRAQEWRERGNTGVTSN